MISPWRTHSNLCTCMKACFNCAVLLYLIWFPALLTLKILLVLPSFLSFLVSLWIMEELSVMSILRFTVSMMDFKMCYYIFNFFNLFLLFHPHFISSYCFSSSYSSHCFLPLSGGPGHFKIINHFWMSTSIFKLRYASLQVQRSLK